MIVAIETFFFPRKEDNNCLMAEKLFFDSSRHSQSELAYCVFIPASEYSRSLDPVGQTSR